MLHGSRFPGTPKAGLLHAHTLMTNEMIINIVLEAYSCVWEAVRTYSCLGERIVQPADRSAQPCETPRNSSHT